MKLIHTHLLPITKYIKSLILMLLVLPAAILNANAQSSGLRIATSGEVNIMRDGEVRISGIESNTAALRKTVVSNAANNFNNQTPAQLQNPAGSTKESTTKEIVASEATEKETEPKETTENEKNKETSPATKVKKNSPINTLAVPATTTVTSSTIYDIPGATAIPSRQYTSLQAGFKFFYYDGHRVQQSPAGVIELYKLEKGINTRSFCIPSGGCASVNIPIQITDNGQPVVANESAYRSPGAGTGKPSLYQVVIPNGGYLQPGEYAFIDKASLTREGSLVCFTFTVKQ